MVDIENIIIHSVKNALQEAHPDAVLYGSRERTPVKFPCVMVYEVNNSEVFELATVDRVERYTDIAYTVEVYTNDADRKKEHAKNIFKTVDDTLRVLVKNEQFNIAGGLYRTGKAYSEGFNESEMCCIIGNYIGRIGYDPKTETVTFYRR